MEPGATLFALNHMAAPALSLAALFKLARSLGIASVEIRNDLAGNAILDGTSAEKVSEIAKQSGIDIISINALQKFNDWTPEREREAVELADYAARAGVRALVLVPRNDGNGREDGQRLDNLVKALKGLQPILAARGLTGLVEPLGFEICSLRLKSEAVTGIDAVGGADLFKLVHDTFHHHLAGEEAIFPARTGLVHISGVSDAAVSVGDMRDSHRVLVNRADRLGNLAQIRALAAGGYAGSLSFEPFADSVHRLDETAVRADLSASMEFLEDGISA